MAKKMHVSGLSGKSAYKYAQEGGYTGTEEEFAAKLAAESPTKEEFEKVEQKVNNLNGTGTQIYVVQDEEGTIVIQPNEGEDLNSAVTISVTQADDGTIVVGGVS